MDAQAVSQSHPVLGKLAVEVGNAVQHGFLLLKYYLCYKIDLGQSQ